MNIKISNLEELFPLLHELVEGQLTDQGQTRLNDLLRADKALIDVYAEYMFIHGLLHHDAGHITESALQQQTELAAPVASVNAVSGRRVNRRIVAVAASLLAMLGLWFVSSAGSNDQQNLAEAPVNEAASDDNSATVVAAQGTDGSSAVVKNDSTAVTGEFDSLKPLKLNHVAANNESKSNAGNHESLSVESSDTNRLPRPELLAATFLDADVSAKIDSLLAAGWAEQGVSPSPLATDLEWVRRVYLTFAGRIPTLQESNAFLAQTGARKYSALIDQISDSSERASNLAVVWSNLLIGRTAKRGVNREKLQEFLVQSFRTNQPWIDVVGELVTAKGRNDQNGATNFLLAHLNNQATPATAVTARLFLGEQISCVQCHDHPFDKGLRQQDYWALNAFFKDTDRVSVALAMTDSPDGKPVQDIAWKLVDRPRPDRMTYYETRAGQEKAVLPRYDDQTLPESSDANRRQELARLVANDSSHKVAKAMVNRMWSHFYGFGFTAEIDDMGAHAAISHPELLDLLTEAFIKSDYDMKRLMKWIGQSNSWRLSSEVVDANLVDAPASGEVPLFSRVYVRRMTPEQVYESIRVAIRSASGQTVSHSQADEKHRRDWVAQFAQSYGTDENDESMDFDGTIAQAMVMMNGIDVDDAIRQATQAMVGNVAARKASNLETLDRVALAMLTRKPTAGEKKVFANHHRQLATQSAATALPTAVEDMMWAYLNSSEFVLVH